MNEDKWFYQNNDDLLNSDLNKTFAEILWMSNEDFRSWLYDLRKFVVKVWDEKGIPPKTGKQKSDIIKEMSKIRSYPIFHKKDGVEKIDLETNQKDCITNNTKLGNCANQWFPNMMTTKISYTKNLSDALSIYDHFKEDSLFDKMLLYAKRNFKRDSFYHYSPVVKKYSDKESVDSYVKKYFIEPKDSAKSWILAYEQNRNGYEKDFDYWLDPVSDNQSYTGYNEELNLNNFFLSFDEYEEISNSIDDKCKVNINHKTLKNKNFYQIRIFKRDTKLFPVGLKAFRVTFCQQAVNFPPLTARYLYERFTEHIKDQEVINIWDPSAGWGGRILGAMSIENDVRKVHYIGTDPNTDNTTENGRTKYHELADFYNKYNHSAFSNDAHTYEIYQVGSENMHKEENFQKYKGKLDLVFTSPPYFCKEVYSEDDTQSSRKFSEYEDWLEYYLKPTLKTAYDWLAPNRYLIWNIADINLGKNANYELEKYTHDLLTSFGMSYEGKLKMTLAQMPGGNRVDPVTGKPNCKNFCRIKETTRGIKVAKKHLWLKYEPIFIFKKI